MRSRRYLSSEMFYEMEKCVSVGMKRQLVRMGGVGLRYRNMYPAMYDIEDDVVEEALLSRFGTEVV